MATDVFISYSRKDSAFARKLVDALAVKGRNSWVDWEGIPYSADWWREICEGIDAADTFVFIISPDSLASEICNREFDYAHSADKRIIPVMHRTIDEKTIAGEWFEKEWEVTARRNWAELKKLNWLFFRDTDDFNKAFGSLIETAEQDPDHVRQHTRLLIRAREWEANGRKAAYALRGEDLREAEIWQAASAGKLPPPNELHTAYILASQQVRKDDQSRARALTQARFGIVLAIALFAIVGLVFLNLRSGEQTSANATLAAQSTLVNDNLTTAVAAQATSQRRTDESQSLLWTYLAQQQAAINDFPSALSLIVEANRIPNPPAIAQNALSSIAYPPGLRRQFNDPELAFHVVTTNFSPDGRSVLAGDDAGNLFVWDVDSTRKIQQFKARGAVDFAAFMPDGNKILASSSYDDLVLWDLNTTQEIRRYKIPATRQRTVTLSPDGSKIAFGNWEDVVIWDLNTDKQIRHFTRSDSSVLATAFSPDGLTVLAAYENGELILWDADTGKVIHSFTGHNISIYTASFSHDGSMIISGDKDGILILWNTATAVEIRRFTGHSLGVRSADLSPDGGLVISSGYNNEIILWDVNTGEEVRRFAFAQINDLQTVQRVKFSPDGHSIISCGSDHAVMIWGITNGAEIHHLGGDNTITNATISADGHTIMFGGNNQKISLWDVNNWKEIYTFDGLDAYSTNTQFSPDGKTAAAAGDKGRLILWEIGTGKILHNLIGHSDSFIHGLGFSPDGHILASGGDNGELFLWDVDTGKMIRRLYGHLKSVSNVSFSPDGHTLVSSGENGELFLWDVNSGEVLHPIVGKGSSAFSGVSCAVFSPDGRQLLSCADNATLLLWDVSTGQFIRSYSTQQAGSDMTSAAFSPDGRTFVSGSFQGDVLLWDVDTGEQIRSFVGHKVEFLNYIVTTLFTPDGRNILSMSFDGELILWRIDRLDELIEWTLVNRAAAPLTCEQRIRYGVSPYCDTQGTPPVITPFLTWTPSPTPSTTPTPDPLRTTATYTSSIIATRPTSTPNSTMAVAAQQLTATSDTKGTESVSDQMTGTAFWATSDAINASTYQTYTAMAVMIETLEPALTSTQESIEQTGTAVEFMLRVQPTITLTPSYTATATPLPPSAMPTSNLATQTAEMATIEAYSKATQTSSLLTATVQTFTPSPTPT